MKYFVEDPELRQLYKKHDDDAGFDICAKQNLLIEDDKWYAIPTGLYLAIPKGHVGILKPRSGLSLRFNTDIHAGVIDSNYRGEVVAVISVDHPPFFIERGDRIAQLLILELPKIELEKVATLSELGDTDRGAGGFGSTGSH